MEDLVYGLGLISRDFVPKLVHTRETEIAVLTRLAVDVKTVNHHIGISGAAKYGAVL
jgi:hypothetical protein